MSESKKASNFFKDMLDASRFGHALVDRRLYLPRAWAEDRTRRAKTAIPENIAFATKPEIARDLIASARDAGTPCAFVLGDALYGSDSKLAVCCRSASRLTT